MEEYNACLAKHQDEYIPRDFGDGNKRLTVELTDCYLRAFQLEGGVEKTLAGMEVCEAEYNQKRSARWQTILDKFNK